MDGVSLAIFLLTAFLGGLTNGLAGFAMGLVVSGFWLHLIPPAQNAFLLAAYSLVMQSYGIWKLRHALDWRKVAPFVIGGAIGVPIGTFLLTYVNPGDLRAAIGALLVLYALNGLVRPAIAPIRAGVTADGAVGFANGLIAGLTGLTGAVVSVWCQLRDWPKDAQRSIYQPVIITMSAMATTSLAASGTVTAHTLKLFVIGLPPLLFGTWAGFRLYDRLDDAAFRKLILVVLLLSGSALIVPFH